MAGISKDGVDLDPIWTSGWMTGTFTAGTWYDTGFERDDGTDSHMLLVPFVSGFHAGVNMYYCKGSTTPFRWHPYPSNHSGRCSVNSDGPWMGHAPNSYSRVESLLEFGILHQSGGAAQKIQFKTTDTFSGLTGSDGRQLSFALYKIT